MATKDLLAIQAVPITRDEALHAIKSLEDHRVGEHPETFAKAAEAMKQHIGDLEVQRKGVFAMSYGSITCGRYVVKVHGLEAVIAAMGRYPNEERLQQDGCEMIRYISTTGDGARRVIEAGGLKAVTAALGFHGDSMIVQQECCGALKNFAARDAAATLAAGGLQAVLKVMEMGPRYSWIQMWGCQALLHFARKDSQRVLDNSGFDAAAAALRAHGSVEVVRRAAEAVVKYKHEFVSKD